MTPVWLDLPAFTLAVIALVAAGRSRWRAAATKADKATAAAAFAAAVVITMKTLQVGCTAGGIEIVINGRRLF